MIIDGNMFKKVSNMYFVKNPILPERIVDRDLIIRSFKIKDETSFKKFIEDNRLLEVFAIVIFNNQPIYIYEALKYNKTNKHWITNGYDIHEKSFDLKFSKDPFIGDSYDGYIEVQPKQVFVNWD